MDSSELLDTTWDVIPDTIKPACGLKLLKKEPLYSANILEEDVDKKWITAKPSSI